MCTSIIGFDPTAEWPLVVAFVRDEDRARETLSPGFWWDTLPTVVGGRDGVAGGTWLAVDIGESPASPGQIAFVQNQIGPHVIHADLPSFPSRGTLPLIALDDGYGFDLRALPNLHLYQPFHLVTARYDNSDRNDVDWWQWNGVEVEHIGLEPGVHLVASRGIGLPGERERRATLLERFAGVDQPQPDVQLDPAAAWGPWIDLLDGRHAQPNDVGGLVVHSVAERPGFGTVGATLVGVAADGRVRYDVNTTTTLAPDAWSQVEVTDAGAVAR